jgi:hypothetical protein
VEAALEVLLAAGHTPNLVSVKELTHVDKGALPDIQIPVPDLFSYDELLLFLPQAHKEVQS